MEIISYEVAKEKGEGKYFTGIPCKHGHISQRYVTNKTCIACASNSDKKYVKNNAEKSTARRRAYRKKNIKALREKDRIYRENHKLERSVAKRNHKKAVKERTPDWFGEFDDLVLFEATELCNIRREETGFDWHIDHMFPMKAKNVCGLHCAENFQVIPAVINVSKSNKCIMTERYEWLKVAA